MSQEQMTREEWLKILETSTLEEIFDKYMPQRIGSAVERFKDQMAGIEGILQFNLTGEGGGQWYLTIGAGTAKVTKGEAEEPTTTFTAEASDYLALMQRKVDPQALFMSGKLRIAGDMSLAMRLGQVIRQAMAEVEAASSAPSAPAAPPAEEKPKVAEMTPEQWRELVEKATLQEVFDVYMPQRMGVAAERFKDQLAGLDGILQFNMEGEGGGQWYITIKEGTISVTKGEAEEPTTTFTAQASDYLGMLQRKVDPQALFMSGKLRIAGDMSLAMRLGQLIRSMSQQ